MQLWKTEVKGESGPSTSCSQPFTLVKMVDELEREDAIPPHCEGVHVQAITTSLVLTSSGCTGL